MENEIKIVCDNKQCSYEGEQLIKFSQLKEFLNKGCPICGDNLLTEDDYNRTVELIDSLEKLKSIEIDYDKLSEETGLSIEFLKKQIEVTFGTHKEVKIIDVK